jgi:hypothetical protein
VCSVVLNTKHVLPRCTHYAEKTLQLTRCVL